MSELVLVTGAGGFIAKHVIRELLANGYAVRGTVRKESAADGVRAVVEPGSELEFTTADLLADSGWDAAMDGVSAVLHVASPFPMTVSKGREDLVPAAVGGTRRVLGAARRSGVERVVLTSSIAAMAYRADRPRVCPVREGDWTDPNWGPATPYIISKTRAERAAWDMGQPGLTTVNPGLVLGPALDVHTSTSLQVLKLLLDGSQPMVPPTGLCLADVRDVAAVHVAALSRPETIGRRLLVAGPSIRFTQVARLIRDHYGSAAGKVPTREAPEILIRLLARVDRTVKTALPDLGVTLQPEADYVTELTGVRLRGPREAIFSGVDSLLEHAQVSAG